MTTTKLALNPNYFTDRHFESALRLLNALRPHEWNAGEWVFRGHGDADWPLVPKAVRADGELAALSGEPLLAVAESSWSRRAVLHDRMLRHFATQLERAGLPIPQPNHRAWLLDGYNTMSSSAHPERELWPLVALAQHHGLPTIFLDWSRRSLVAAYFAAEDALRKEREGRIAVWALDVSDAVDRDRLDGVLDYTAPSHANRNMFAQAGLFTVYPAIEGEESLDATVHRIHGAEGRHMLHRLTLPAGEGRQLLRLLAAEGIDAGSMFPGVDGVVRGMIERSWWRVVP